MHNVKFIQILKTLSKVELKHFGKFLESPIYNTNSTLVKLFNYAKKYYPAFDHTGLKKEMVYRKLFPGEHFKEKKLRYLSSEMLKQLEKFLFFLSTKSTNRNTMIDNEIKLLQVLGDRGLFSFTTSKYKNLSKKIESIAYKEPNDYYSLFILQNIYKDSVYNTNVNILKNIDILQSIIDNFINFVALLSKDVILDKNLVSPLYADFKNSNILERISNLASITGMEQSKSISLWDKLISLSNGNDDKVFKEVNEMLNSGKYAFNIEFRARLRTVLLEYLNINRQ